MEVGTFVEVVSLTSKAMLIRICTFGHGRNVQLQEQLWEISINIVKDHLTPDVMSKYGAPQSYRTVDVCERGQEAAGVDEQVSDNALHQQHHQQLTEGGGDQEETGAEANDQENTGVKGTETVASSSESGGQEVEADTSAEDKEKATHDPEN